MYQQCPEFVLKLQKFGKNDHTLNIFYQDIEKKECSLWYKWYEF